MGTFYSVSQCTNLLARWIPRQAYGRIRKTLHGGVLFPKSTSKDLPGIPWAAQNWKTEKGIHSFPTKHRVHNWFTIGAEFLWVHLWLYQNHWERHQGKSTRGRNRLKFCVDKTFLQAIEQRDKCQASKEKLIEKQRSLGVELQGLLAGKTTMKSLISRKDKSSEVEACERHIEEVWFLEKRFVKSFNRWKKSLKWWPNCIIWSHSSLPSMKSNFSK